MPYYKAVMRGSHISHYDKRTKWAVGKTVRVAHPDESDAPCSRGIHIAKTLLDAVRFQRGPSDYFEVAHAGEIWAEDEEKMRCTGAKVLRLLSKEEQDEIAGFKLWEANHPVNPLLLPRYESIDLNTTLKEWATVMDSVNASVSDSVMDSVNTSVNASVRDAVVDSVGIVIWDSIWKSIRTSLDAYVVDSAWDFIRDSVRDSFGIFPKFSIMGYVWDSVNASVWAYVGGLFPSIKKWRYVKGSDPWRPLLTLWYGGYIPSFDGTTWRLHAGKHAQVVHEWTVR